MRMFENKTKPELERGNFIAYADEPGTIVSGSGGGGGGGGDIAVFNVDVDPDTQTYSPTFTYNEVKDALISGKFPFTKTAISGPDGVTTYETSPIFTIADNASDSFSVTDYNNNYVATSPDELMQPE